MRLTVTWAIAAGLATLFVFLSSAHGGSQKRKAVMMTRLYTGPDGQTHAEETEAKFTAGRPNEVFKLMGITGAELHRAAPGTVLDWHTAPRRQYVITLSGQAELEVSGEKRYTWDPVTSTLSKTLRAKATLRESRALRIV
jgi:hypothetical protein